ncbi:MAG: HAD-IIA family hydrolase [Methanobacteriota archaeon]
MRELKQALQKMSAVILDMDGVLYRGSEPIKGAAKAVAFLRNSGKKVIFLTNNSESSRSSYVKKLASMGIPASEGEVVTSGQVTADYIKARDPNARVFAIGGEGLMQELKREGLHLVKHEKATHVVVGIDRSVTYEKLKGGFRALLSGAEFIATNPDNVYPTEKGLSPGAGAIIGALERSSARKPNAVMGKPSPYIIQFVLRILGTRPSETAIIGDQIDTDIKAGSRTGLMTVLVLSGVSKAEDVKRASGTKNAPDFVIDSLMGVIS